MATTVEGTVASVNDKGVRLLGHDTWANFSRFAEGLVPPVRGEVVSLTLDKAGFVRAVAPAPVSGASIDSLRSLRTESDAPAAPSAPSTRDRVLSEDTSRRISRLAILKAASEFAAARPMLKSGDVLKIAASWERWVNRADDAEQTTVACPEGAERLERDLTDAF